MADPVEITRDITTAWLNAYETDLSVRRQKGVVPVFTPTNEEVMEFITAAYAKVLEMTEKSGKAQETKPAAKKKP
ncbi:MAG: hypothetical protein RDV48_06290 [Candidatus Eremiobacteraeota bacterium]|nr:hypothetical protein [Candidatus Eremiobacteraeota bacterium]